MAAVDRRKGVAPEFSPRFGPLAELAAREDDHPEVRLGLLAEVARVLEGPEPARPGERATLADRLERWRAQFLNHRDGRLTPEQCRLTRGLDRLRAELAGRPERPPRALREALEDARTAPLDPDLARSVDPATPIEQVEEQARRLTAERSAGPRSMLLYAPLYVSNHCINHCLYCGFRYPNAMPREQLDEAATLAEAEVLWGRGFRHVLVVAGEYPRLITIDYLAGIAAALVRRGFSVAVEVAPHSTFDYTRLRDAGVSGVTLYQEVYDQALYAGYHPKGTKAWYDWRLEGPERAAEAGVARVGLGVLLGLGEPLAELRALIAHGRYLLDRFPDLGLAFSLPRIREAPEGFQPRHRVDDETLVRHYAALRMAFPDANLVLSTRESPALRDRLAACCITQMSAGSSTAPGGYQDRADGDSCDRQQFPVFDHRSPAEVAAMLEAAGIGVRWDVAPVAGS